MKQAVAAILFLGLGAGSAFAQGDPDLDRLEKHFKESMKKLEQKFEHERAALEKEFKAAREKLVEKKRVPTPHRKHPKAMPKRRTEDEFRNMEEMLKRVLEQARRGFDRGRHAVPKAMPREVPKDLEKVLEDIQKRLKRLEEQFDGKKPQFRQFRWQGPKDFEFDFDFKDFKDFERFMPKDEREWKEWLPKFRQKFRRQFEDRDEDDKNF